MERICSEWWHWQRRQSYVQFVSTHECWKRGFSNSHTLTVYTTPIKNCDWWSYTIVHDHGRRCQNYAKEGGTRSQRTIRGGRCPPILDRSLGEGFPSPVKNLTFFSAKMTRLGPCFGAHKILHTWGDMSPPLATPPVHEDVMTMLLLCAVHNAALLCAAVSRRRWRVQLTVRHSAHSSKRLHEMRTDRRTDR